MSNRSTTPSTWRALSQKAVALVTALAFFSVSLSIHGCAVEMSESERLDKGLASLVKGLKYSDELLDFLKSVINITSSKAPDAIKAGEEIKAWERIVGVADEIGDNTSVAGTSVDFIVDLFGDPIAARQKLLTLRNELEIAQDSTKRAGGDWGAFDFRIKTVDIVDGLAQELTDAIGWLRPNAGWWGQRRNQKEVRKLAEAIGDEFRNGTGSPYDRGARLVNSMRRFEMNMTRNLESAASGGGGGGRAPGWNPLGWVPWLLSRPGKLLQFLGLGVTAITAIVLWNLLPVVEFLPGFIKNRLPESWRAEEGQAIGEISDTLNDVEGGSARAGREQRERRGEILNEDAPEVFGVDTLDDLPSVTERDAANQAELDNFREEQLRRFEEAEDLAERGGNLVDQAAAENLPVDKVVLPVQCDAVAAESQVLHKGARPNEENTCISVMVGARLTVDGEPYSIIYEASTLTGESKIGRISDTMKRACNLTVVALTRQIAATKPDAVIDTMETSPCGRVNRGKMRTECAENLQVITIAGAGDAGATANFVPGELIVVGESRELRLAPVGHPDPGPGDDDGFCGYVESY